MDETNQWEIVYDFTHITSRIIQNKKLVTYIGNIKISCTQQQKLKKICKDKTKPNTITFLINVGPLQNKRMTSDAFKNTYIYYQPSAEGGEKFEYKIEGDTLSKKIFPKNPIKSMFSFFGKKKK